MDIFSLVGAGSTLTLVGLCIKLANGRNCYIKRTECHSAMDSVKDSIKELEKHIDTRIGDLKDYLEKR